MSNSRIKTDIKKCLFSSNTIILIVTILILTCVNYYFSYTTKLELIRQLSSGAKDLNINKLKIWIENYNGFEFFFRYYNLSDELNISILALLAWIGIFVVGPYSRYRENGYGNLLVVRLKYKIFLRNYVISRSIYIVFSLAIVILMQLVVAFFIGGFGSFVYNAGEYTYGFMQCMLIIFLQYILIVFYSVIIFLISVSLSFLIRSSYILQIFPVIAFGILPMLIFSTLANVFNWSQFLADVFVPFLYMTKGMIIIRTLNMQDAVSTIVSIAIFLAISIVIYNINIKKMEGNYL